MEKRVNLNKVSTCVVTKKIYAGYKETYMLQGDMQVTRRLSTMQQFLVHVLT